MSAEPRVPARYARPVVAIDGPSGAGKSTVARALAARLGLRYLDTGAMYRALTWAVLAAGIAPEDAAAVAAYAPGVEVSVSTDPAPAVVRVGAQEVSGEIRGPAVTGAVSAVSAVPAVRAAMVARQREIVGDGGIVVEGRDIGGVVLPGADVKVFLTATERARAERRAAEDDAPAAATLGALQRRDRLDSGRAVSPLTRAPDAIEIDSTALSVDAVVERIAAALAAAR